MNEQGIHNAKKEQEHFDQLAESMGEIWWGSTTPAGIMRLKRRVQLIKEELALFHNPIVLEIGCGTGAFTKFILEALPLLKLTTFDISFKSVQLAAKRFSGYKNARFSVAESTSLPYDSGIFDAVIGNSILHHLPLGPSLEEVLRIMKPGGLLFFFEPNMFNPQIAIEKNIHFIGKYLQNTENETAFFRWPLTKILRKAGVQDVCVIPFDFLHPIVPGPISSLIDGLGKVLEKIPLLKEFSGSLLISGRKR